MPPPAGTIAALAGARGGSRAVVNGTVLLLAAVGSLSLPTIARADGVEISQRLIDDAGWPMLVANHVPDGSRGMVSWRVCAPSCGQVVATGSVYSAGPTAIGTTFEASTTVDGKTTHALSPPWAGQVTSATPPTFDGELRVGQTLSPHAGTWAGGWGDDRSLLGMRACTTRAAQDCRSMTDVRVASHATIGAAYSGWYVGAIETRIGSGTVFTASAWAISPGRVSPFAAPMPARTVAAGALSGPILGSSDGGGDGAGSAARPQFTSRATVRERATRLRGALVLGSIRCSGRCVAHVTLRHGRKTWTRRIVITAGRASIKLSPGTFSRRATVVHVTVGFDNHARTTRRSVKLH